MTRTLHRSVGPLALLALASTMGCSEYNVGKNDGPVRIDDTAIAPDPPTTTSPTTGTEWSWGTGTATGGTGTGTGNGGTATGGTATGTGTGGTPRDPTEVVDGEIQPAEFLVDVLWVVDNSCSMGDDQDSLTQNFPSFIDYFEQVTGIDYRLGVVSTDVEDGNHEGKLREANGVRWIDNNTADKLGTFNSMALMGTSGSGDEAGRAAVHHATQTHVNGWNAGFFRANASLAVIVITDEDDSSSMFGVDLAPFVSDLQTFKNDPGMVSFSAIAGPVPNGCATADPATQYVDVQTQIGGVFYDICSNNWDQILQGLAAEALGNRREFFLTDIPDEATIEIEVVDPDGTVTWFQLNNDFTYDAARNSVTFISYIPGPLAAVYVHYQPLFGAGW